MITRCPGLLPADVQEVLRITVKDRAEKRGKRAKNAKERARCYFEVALSLTRDTVRKACTDVVKHNADVLDLPAFFLVKWNSGMAKRREANAAKTAQIRLRRSQAKQKKEELEAEETPLEAS